MLSAVKTARNHYDVLGLAPTATQQEIAGAFNAAMGMFGGRPTTGAMRVCQAFEVLRNPATRKAYDRRMGFTRSSQLYRWPSSPAPRFTAPVRVTPARDRERPNMAAIPAEPRSLVRESAPDSRAADQRAAEARVSELVASLRKLAEPTAPKVEERGAVSKPAPPRRDPPDPKQPVEPFIEQLVAFERAQRDGAGQRSSSPWTRPASAVGGLVVGAGILGGLLGMSAIGGPDPEPSVAVQLPEARPRPVTSSPGAAVAPFQAETLGLKPVPTVRAQVATPRTRPMVAATPPSPVVEQTQPEELTAVAAEENPSKTIAADPLAPTPEEAELSAAKMPLPGPVVARTIRRIGYRCDQVASATAIADGPGAFLVTCSSGDSYRASPVRGRYHFRRVGAR